MELLVSDAEYRARPEFSQSLIKEVLKKTPKVFDYEQKHKIKSSSKFMDFGSMLHCRILEPTEFDKRYKVFDLDEYIDKYCEVFHSEQKKTTKAYRAELDIFKFENPDYFVVENAEYKVWEKSDNKKLTAIYKKCVEDFLVRFPTHEMVAKDVYDSVLAAEKSAREYTSLFDRLGEKGVHTELAVVNEIFGVPFKGKFDYIDVENGLILDVKNTVDSLDDETLEKHTLKWDFPIQCAAYCELAKQEYGIDFTFVFLMINSFAPYECRFINMSDIVTQEKMIAGRQYVKEGLEKLQQWKNNDPDFYKLKPYINDNVPPWYHRKYRENGE